MIEHGSYVRLNLGGTPPKYKYGQLLQDPWGKGSRSWYLKSDTEDGSGFGYMLLTNDRIARLEELTEQDYFLLMLAKPPSDR